MWVCTGNFMMGSDQTVGIMTTHSRMKLNQSDEASNFMLVTRCLYKQTIDEYIFCLLTNKCVTKISAFGYAFNITKLVTAVSTLQQAIVFHSGTFIKQPA